MIHEDAWIHPTSADEVGGYVKVGAGTKVWRWVQLLGRSEIGEDCNIGSHCCVEGAILGDRVKVGNHSLLFEGLIVGNDVFIGPRFTSTNVKYPNPKRKAKYYEKTVIEDNVTIGANVTIVCGVTIGEGAFIGAGSTVTKDVPPGFRVKGNPAK